MDQFQSWKEDHIRKSALTPSYVGWNVLLFAITYTKETDERTMNATREAFNNSTVVSELNE